MAAELHAKGYAVYEMHHPDPAKNGEVVAVLVGATKLPKKWLD